MKLDCTIFFFKETIPSNNWYFGRQLRIIPINEWKQVRGKGHGNELEGRGMEVNKREGKGKCGSNELASCLTWSKKKSTWNKILPNRTYGRTYGHVRHRTYGHGRHTTEFKHRDGSRQTQTQQTGLVRNTQKRYVFPPGVFHGNGNQTYGHFHNKGWNPVSFGLKFQFKFLYILLLKSCFEMSKFVKIKTFRSLNLLFNVNVFVTIMVDMVNLTKKGVL